MPTALADNSVEIRDHVFSLLKSRGPLCASQISVEMGLPLKGVRTALKDLQAEGLVAPRPDRDKSVTYSEIEMPWGVSRPSLFRRAAR